MSIYNAAIPLRPGGPTSPERAWFDPVVEVEDLLREMADSSRLGAVELVGHVAPEVPGRLLGDPKPVRQVLFSLTANALKCTEKGEVLVEMGVEARTDAGLRLGLTVRDTGRGIPMERQDGLFESSSGKGDTGLPLGAIVRLLEQWGSRLEVESCPSRGSTFRFTAPFGHAPAAASPSFTPPPEWRDRPILVVDDSPVCGRALDTLLKAWGLRPQTVNGGQTALEVLEAASRRGESFAAVVLDARMPQLSGFAVADRLRRDPRLNAPTVVLLPPSHRKGDLEYCQRLGVAAHVSKPIRRAELFFALGKALAGPVAAAPVAPSRRMKVLLAGDNPDVQQRAAEWFRDQGHGVTVVADGQDALRLLGEGSFDLALLDLQVPGLNGLETVCRLRGREAGGRPRLPVIALGDRPGPGERERCLLAGFDGYVTKPVHPRELSAVMNRLAQSTSPADVIQALTSQPAFDRAAALEQLDGDESLLQELAGLFLEDCPQQMEALRQAVAAGDPSGLQEAAHAFKGAVVAFAAGSTVEAARRLEEMGRTGNLAGAAEALAVLEEQVQRLRPALAILMPPLCNM